MGRIRSDRQMAVPSPYAIDPASDRRLANWGRWCRGSGSGASQAQLWRLGGPGRLAGVYGAPTVTVIDVADARAVEACVCAPGFAPAYRELLKAHWVSEWPQHRICAALGIHRYHFEERLHRAVQYFCERG